MTKTSLSAGLDPETDFEQISRNLATYEFPWDIMQALSFALFRTYAVPSIGRLLDETGEFTGRVQKRYDDTALLLEEPLINGFSSAEGRSAVRRINQMHKMYDISDDDMRYVLSTFVVVPVRWIEDYGWRRLTPDEVRATVRYYQTLGKHMAIPDIPETYEEFADLMDSYEAQHFAYDPGARRVADSTLALLNSFYPRPAARAVDVFSRALMDEPLIKAFRFREPGPLARRIAVGSLKARGRLLAVLPPRRRAQLVRDSRRIRSYPFGFQVEKMGTFAPGCPVNHRAAAPEGDGAVAPRERAVR
ncbi:oxygenase MpaB family protein [Tsukamurella sp. 1534]|uniref:oxygenase MpaB family protein n=1 Tax=Tsukamurella sp. 1534 TaxID=1151061 RepID=UPI00030BE196|nr:oxygenase MpaB family protein [Tsukamurella sp. 1534]